MMDIHTTPKPQRPYATEVYERRHVYYSSVQRQQPEQVTAATVTAAPGSRMHLQALLSAFSKRRFQVGAALLTAFVVVLTVCIPMFTSRLEAASYDLSAARALVDPTSAELNAKVVFDQKSQSWVFNQNAAAQLPGNSDNALKAGGVPYSATLPVNLSHDTALTLTDPQSKLNITLSPDFGVGAGQMHEGYAVYPLDNGANQLIYTFKQNGLKEDIVLRGSQHDTATYTYTLGLPDSLQARVQADGSVGIFGGDPSLFGNISYGSSADQALVEKARTHSKKNHLQYVIPAPVVKGSGTSGVRTKFVLKGNHLTVVTTGLEKAHYPLSIDPSFVMDTTGCGWAAGNNEGGLSINGCQLSRSTLSGGTLGTWGTPGSGATYNQASYNSASVAYNGRLYLLSGSIGSGANTSSVQFATISTDGTLSAWHYTHNSTDDGTTYVSGFAQTAQGFGVAAYNGYLYIAGGLNGATVLNTVQYAPLNTNGTVGVWQAAGAGSAMNTARTQFGFEVSNGYLYAYAGCTASPSGCTSTSKTLEYARINGDGTLTAWTLSANNMTTTRYNVGSAVYNGYLYALGGCVAITLGSCTSVLNSVEYAAINADGSVGTWTTTASFATARTGLSAIAANGYLYLLGGNLQSDVQLAKVYANGSLGPWNATTSLTTARYAAAVAAYNGYIYLAGGCSNNVSNCANGILSDVQYNHISTVLGMTSAYSTPATYDSSNTRTGAGVTVYGGYLYVVSGAAAGSTYTGTVQYARLNADGSIGSWTTSSTSVNNTASAGFCATAGNCAGRYSLAAAAYNGYL